MQHVVFKTVKFTLWGILLLFVSSHGVPAYPQIYSLPEAGTYELHANGEEDLGLLGSVSFESLQETGENGRTYSVLKLHLDGNEKKAPHTLGIFIARDEQKEPIGKGTYAFNKDIDGFLTHFEGVFGFASINAYGERPYFAKEGKLTIGHVGDETLSGSLSISMENDHGKTLQIGGNFNALLKE
jgi:hypothetical protein